MIVLSTQSSGAQLFVSEGQFNWHTNPTHRVSDHLCFFSLFFVLFRINCGGQGGRREKSRVSPVLVFQILEMIWNRSDFLLTAASNIWQIEMNMLQLAWGWWSHIPKIPTQKSMKPKYLDWNAISKYKHAFLKNVGAGTIMIKLREWLYRCACDLALLMCIFPQIHWTTGLRQTYEAALHWVWS